jgi:alpha-D-xyloside xylohydrolase
MDGGQNRVVAAPYEQIPVYAKAGSIIPLGPEIQYVGEKPDAPVTIFVYGGADGSFTLYEDEGVNYNYERGAFSAIEFAYNDKEGSLIIGERKGSFEGMAENRQFNVVLVDQGKPLPLAYDVATDHSVNYSGKAITINF